MRRDAYGLALLTVLLSAGHAMGQSAIAQQNSAVNQVPQGMQRYDQRWLNVGSGHSSIGLESTPHSLDLRFPQSSGMPRPTYGFRPDPLHTYVPPSSAQRGPLQDRFALPRAMQPPASVYQAPAGQTRFMVDYAGPAAVPQQERPQSPVIEPVSPIQINPVGPAKPLDRSLTPYPRGTTPGGGTPVLQLPRLPWENPAEPGPETTTPQPGAKLLGAPAPLALPRGGEGNLRLPPGTGSPLDLILQGGPGQAVEPRHEVLSGSLLRPIATPPEQTEPQAAGGVQTPAMTPVPPPPEMATAATLSAVARKHLEKAEAHLKAGEYAKAATSYDLARVVAPKSPVPHLGRAVALLGAGEYNSAANSLLMAVALSPEPATLRQDFDNLLPDRTLVKERIKDLKADLARFDDFRLRFLLGYAEYCGGDETVGMIDMTQAVHKMPPERTAARSLLDALRKDQLRRSATTTAPASGR